MPTPLRSPLALWVVVSLAVGLVACREPTQIELQVSTDVPYAAGRTIAFTMGPVGQTETRPPNVVTDLTWGADGKVGSLVVTPSGDSDEDVEVKIAMGVGRSPEGCSVTDGANCIVTRRQLSFVPNRSLGLPIGLFSLCEGVPCGQNSTCNALGACVPNALDAQGCAEHGGPACVVQGDEVLVESSLMPDTGGGAGGMGGTGGAVAGGAGAGGATGAATDPFCPAASQDQSIAQDDFEGNAEGALPAGWVVIYDGAPGEQYVTSDNAACGSRSLRLLGESNWAGLFMLPFTSSEPVISYEFSIMIEQQGNDIPDRPGFFDPDASQWGTTFAPVRFDHSAREISFEGQVVGTWTAGTWYRVRVVVDRSVGNGTASMWLDGTLQVQDAQLGTAGIANIPGFSVVADHSSVPVHYDDVRIGVVP